MKKEFIFIALLSIHLVFPAFSQNGSSRKTEVDPTMLNKLQGTWMEVTPGERSWYKVQIINNNCKIWHSDPGTGNWNDGASNNDPTRLRIKGCFKITDRNTYDGKLQSESLALTEYDDDGKDGYTLNLHKEDTRLYLRIMWPNGSDWIYCKKVPTNYTPWN